MRFRLNRDKFTTNGVVFLERGIYPVVRFFDSKRVLLDVGRNSGIYEGDTQHSDRSGKEWGRQLTIVPIKSGELISG